MKIKLFETDEDNEVMSGCWSRRMNDNKQKDWVDVCVWMKKEVDGY